MSINIIDCDKKEWYEMRWELLEYGASEIATAIKGDLRGFFDKLSEHEVIDLDLEKAGIDRGDRAAISEALAAAPIVVNRNERMAREAAIEYERLSSWLIGRNLDFVLAFEDAELTDISKLGVLMTGGTWADNKNYMANKNAELAFVRDNLDSAASAQVAKPKILGDAPLEKGSGKFARREQPYRKPRDKRPQAWPAN